MSYTVLYTVQDRIESHMDRNGFILVGLIIITKMIMLSWPESWQTNFYTLHGPLHVFKLNILADLNISQC